MEFSQRILARATRTVSIALALGIGGTSLGASLVHAGSDDAPDHATLARRFAERYAAGTDSVAGGDVEHGTTASFSRVLDSQFVVLPIGRFDLHFPVESLATEVGAAKWQRACEAVLSLEDRFVATVVGAEPRRGKSFTEEGATLSSWIGGWKLRSLQRSLADRNAARPTDSANFVDWIGADDAVRSALEAFRERVLSQADLGPERPRAEPLPEVLIPDRALFVELSCAFAAEVEAARPMLWNDAVFQRTEFVWKELQVLALEYCDPARSAAEYAEGLSMDSREPTGLEQHVAHNLALRLLGATFGGALDPALESGLATDLTVEVVGEDNARVGGSGSSGSTDGRTKFVAGGRPQGGKFPRLNADSSWRAERGSDHFQRALRAGQKRGAKEAPDGLGRKEKEAFMWLASALDPKAGLPVRAPFFGDEPGTAVIPPEFADDSLEFFRAYSAGFVHWLRDQERGEDRSGAATFGRLLRGTASLGENDFGTWLESVYGEPLTGSDRSGPGLEWRFLRELSKH